jgi:hypothetical protein
MALFRGPKLWIFDTLSLEDRLPLAKAYLGQLNWPLRRCTCLLQTGDGFVIIFFYSCIICPVLKGLVWVSALLKGVCIFFASVAVG